MTPSLAMPEWLRSPRLQASMLALVLLAGAAKVVTYDHPPGVEQRDLGAVADALRARGSARVSLTLALDRDTQLGTRTTAEGVFRFSDGTSRVAVSVPGLVANRGFSPAYTVLAAGGRGYVRGIDGGEWVWFDEPDDGMVIGAPTAAGFLLLFEDGGTVRRTGGGSVGGVGCDRYLTEDESGETMELWVDGDGLPRRVAWRAREVNDRDIAVNREWRVDLSGWGEPLEVDVPVEASRVGSPQAALRRLRSPGAS